MLQDVAFGRKICWNINKQMANFVSTRYWKVNNKQHNEEYLLNKVLVNFMYIWKYRDKINVIVNSIIVIGEFILSNVYIYVQNLF